MTAYPWSAQCAAGMLVSNMWPSSKHMCDILGIASMQETFYANLFENIYLKVGKYIDNAYIPIPSNTELFDCQYHSYKQLQIYPTPYALK